MYDGISTFAKRQHRNRNSLGSPDKKDPTERAKTGKMSSYKEQTTSETKEFQKKRTKRSEHKRYPNKPN